MQVQVNTDNHIDGAEGLASHVEATVKGAFERFGDQITRVEVHFNDQNSHKSSTNDKRCLLEARLAGLQPIVVNHDGATVDQALDGAIEKLEKVLDRTLDRKRDHKGKTSFGGDQKI